MKVTSITTPSGERITTNRTLANDLRLTLAREGVAYGDTLGDLFEALIRGGARMNEPLGCIDLGNASTSRWPGARLVVERDEHGHLEIREAR